MRLDACQVSTLCTQLSSLNHLSSLRLSNNVIDLTPDHVERTALDAICSMVSALPALTHLDLSDVCLTDCLHDILASTGRDRLIAIELTRQWLSQRDLTALHQFQQQTTVTVTLN